MKVVYGLHQLILEGTFREFPVVGLVGDRVVHGKIDELERKPEANGTASHAIYLSDCKTRGWPHLPPPRDTVSGRVQLMVYKELFDALLVPSTMTGPKVETGHDAAEKDNADILPTSHTSVFDQIFEKFHLHPDAPFSSSCLRDYQRSIGSVLDEDLNPSRAKTLGDLVVLWDAYTAKLGLGQRDATHRVTSSPVLKIVYRGSKPMQGKPTGSIIGESRFTHNRLWLSEHLAWALDYWSGTRDPVGVGRATASTCDNCEFFQDCEWR